LRFAPLVGARRPHVAHLRRHEERLVGPVCRGTGARHLFGAERRAVHAVGALLGRRALADDRLGDDQRRPHRLLLRQVERRADGLVIVAVDLLDVPVVRLEAPRDVLAHRHVDVALDGDVVVVVDEDQVAEPHVAGERRSLGGYALLHVAVTAQSPDVAVDDRLAQTIETRGHHLRRERHADRRREPSAERPRRQLHADGMAVLGVPRRLRAALAEVLQVVDRQRIARQVQERVEQHGSVPTREHEAVAIRPVRRIRVEAQELAPHDERDVRRAHRRAGMTALGLLHRVGGQETDRVGALFTQLGRYRPDVHGRGGYPHSSTKGMRSRWGPRSAAQRSSGW
jgi:hypothetical protein